MTARLPCLASRDDARRAESESARDARDDAIQAIADEIGNTIEDAIGKFEWSREAIEFFHQVAEKKWKGVQ